MQDSASVRASTPERGSSSLPRLAARNIPRPALISRLNRLAALTLVQAFAGYGKTQLIGSWARALDASGTVVDWVTADASMNAADAVLAHVHRAIARAEHGVDPVLVVIDDADEIDSPDAVSALLALLERLPTLHLVVCSRRVHPIRGAAEGRRIDMQVLSGRELTASADEMSAFADAWGHEVAEDRMAELRSLTGGWLRVMQLVLDDTAVGAASLSPDAASRFLRNSVLPQLGEGRNRDLAFRVAVPHAVTLGAVTALLSQWSDERGDGTESGPALTSVELIDRLHLVGLLERADDCTDDGGEPAWRLPTLIRRVLVQEFEAGHPLEFQAAHRALATHYRLSHTEAGFAASVHHARAGSDWPLLNEIVSERALAMSLAGSRDVMAAVSTIPQHAQDAHPGLGFAASMLEPWVSDPDTDNGRALLRRYMAAGKDGLAELAGFSSAAELSAVTAASIVSLRAAGRVDAALELARRLDTELATRRTRGDAGWSAEPTAWFQFQWSMTALLAGDHAAAQQLSVRAFEAAQSEGNELVASNAAAQLALIHTLSGEAGDAESWLRAHQGFATLGSWTDRLIAVPARIAQVHRALDALDTDAAAALLEEIGDAAQPIEMWAFVADAAARYALLVGEPIVMLARLEHFARVHAAVYQGDGVARPLLERAAIELLLSMGELNRADRRLAESEGHGDPLVVQAARLRLIAGSDDAAQKVAASAVWATETTVRDRAELLVIGAVAEMRLGDSTAAAQSFRRAHALAAHANTLTPYLGIPRAELAELLALADVRLPLGAHERLDGFRSVFPRRAQLISLTEREQVVLAQLVHTDAFSEVAAALTVSVNTVKKQAASAYAKLGVHDRRAALARAHQLGLLTADQQR